MKQIVFILVFILGLALVLAVKQIEILDKKWKDATINMKAYSAQLDASKKDNVAFQMTIDQLRYYGDSIMRELDKTKKELNVKDKNTIALQYVGSTFTKSDTVMLRDTVFKEPAFALDTTLEDQWYSMRIGLSYPSTVAVSPRFHSEKHIIVSSKKETVNPPKKFFLLRWFQKKHRVVKVDVIEKNPYVKDEENTYIHIVK